MTTHAPFLGVALRQQTIRGLSLSENLYPARTELPKHTHESAFFSLTLSGGYVESHARNDLDYGVSSVSFHPAHEEHSVTIGTAPVRCLNVEVGDPWLERLREVDPRAPGLIRVDGGPLVWLATRLHQEFSAWSFVTPLMAEALVLEMLAVSATLRSEEKERRKPRWMWQVEQILRAEYCQSLNVMDLAKRAGVHPVHLSRTWRRFLGCSVGHTLHEIRIAAACRRLATDAPSLAALALEVGFSDQTHFSRVFKQLTGLTPGAYRAAFRP